MGVGARLCRAIRRGPVYSPARPASARSATPQAQGPRAAVQHAPVSYAVQVLQARQARTVPPGVSYTPRDFMPTKRLSTMSTRPMPLSPATCIVTTAAVLLVPPLVQSRHNNLRRLNSYEHGAVRLLYGSI